MSLIIYLCISTLLFVTHFTITTLQTYRRVSHIPGPILNKLTSLPLTLVDMLLDRRAKIEQWHAQHGPIIAISPNEVSAATLTATREIYGSTNRLEKSAYFRHFEGYGERSVFAARGAAEHAAKRKLTAGFYGASSVYNNTVVEGLIRSNLRLCLEHMASGNGDGQWKSVDVYSVASWYAFDNITHLVLGRVHASQTLSKACLERYMLRDLKWNQLWGPFRVRCPWVFGVLSFLAQRLARRFGYLEAEEELSNWSLQRVYGVIQEIEQEQEQTPAQAGTGDGNNSLVRVLYRHISTDSQRGAAKPTVLTLSMSYLAAEVLDNINAAEATASVTATYAIFHLSRLPEWQRRIRTELQQLRLSSQSRRWDDELPSFNDINSAQTLEACLLEVYRLNPAVSGRSERVIPHGGCTIDGAYIPADVSSLIFQFCYSKRRLNQAREQTIISSSAPTIHNNRQIFPYPTEFNPDRWLSATPERRKTMESHLQPFGYGARLCLGKPLATLELKLLLAGIYLRFETRVPSSTTEESMLQSSTHDAVPRGLRCDIEFRMLGGDGDG
ncbi:cytochrome P450 [Aspergillus venezuelensis]